MSKRRRNYDTLPKRDSEVFEERIVSSGKPIVVPLDAPDKWKYGDQLVYYRGISYGLVYIWGVVGLLLVWSLDGLYSYFFKHQRLQDMGLNVNGFNVYNPLLNLPVFAFTLWLCVWLFNKSSHQVKWIKLLHGGAKAEAEMMFGYKRRKIINVNDVRLIKKDLDMSRKSPVVRFTDGGYTYSMQKMGKFLNPNSFYRLLGDKSVPMKYTDFTFKSTNVFGSIEMRNLEKLVAQTRKESPYIEKVVSKEKLL